MQVNLLYINWLLIHFWTFLINISVRMWGLSLKIDLLLTRIWEILCFSPLVSDAYITSFHLIVPCMHILSTTGCLNTEVNHWHTARCKSTPDVYEITSRINLLMHLVPLMLLWDTKGKVNFNISESDLSTYWSHQSSSLALNLTRASGIFWHGRTWYINFYKD